MSSLTIKRMQTATDAEYLSFDVSNGGIDVEWDSFLAALGSNHHLQSSLWAKVKALNGWTTRRISISRNGKIAGGAQILIRNLRLVGAVGYVPRGPVFSSDDSRIEDELLKRLREVAKSERLKLLFVQPPAFGRFEEKLGRSGFRKFPVETAPSATVLIDLQYDLDTIRSRMKKGMRNQVHRSQKRGILVREGRRDDLAVFHELLTATSQRRGFSIFDLSYFQGMWDILEPAGRMKLFISEFDGEAVSAQFCIPFGDTIVAKQIGWSGKHRSLHPNEALDWFTIQWAKENGFTYYDLEGIERPAAISIKEGDGLPEDLKNSPTAYKLRFGGDVRLLPQAYCYLANPLLRAAYNSVGAKVATWSVFQKAIGKFRTR